MNAAEISDDVYPLKEVKLLFKTLYSLKGECSWNASWRCGAPLLGLGFMSCSSVYGQINRCLCHLKSIINGNINSINFTLMFFHDCNSGGLSNGVQSCATLPRSWTPTREERLIKFSGIGPVDESGMPIASRSVRQRHRMCWLIKKNLLAVNCIDLSIFCTRSQHTWVIYWFELTFLCSCYIQGAVFLKV